MTGKPCWECTYYLGREHGDALCKPLVLGFCKNKSCWRESMSDELCMPMKPPIGIMPERVFLNIRLGDLLEAIKRYENAGKIVPMEWKDEVIHLITRIREKNYD